MTVKADSGSDGAIWGRGIYQVTQDLEKVHMGSYWVGTKKEGPKVGREVNDYSLRTWTI